MQCDRPKHTARCFFRPVLSQMWGGDRGYIWVNPVTAMCLCRAGEPFHFFVSGNILFFRSSPMLRNLIVWIPPNLSPIITQMQNCQGNGRPDKDYENWRWKPEECILPRFDGTKFLELMRGKTLAFVGDSVARNQMESLLCILWQVRCFSDTTNDLCSRCN